MELIVPTLGESITEATVSKWLKKVGDSFEADEPLVEIETDKITVESLRQALVRYQKSRSKKAQM